MREALMLQLEKWSYYQHLSLSGGQERPIYSCRVIDIRGSRYHVLSRIQDAGLDFTGRTNFLAHHLVFTPEEIRQLPSPPIILRDWTGWVKSWAKEPELLENEDWSALTKLAASVSVPAKDWQQLTGDAGSGYGLLESRVGIAFRVDNLTDDRILGLFAESLELLELRDPRHDFRATAWQYTFTTSMQEQDNPADFRWRCLHSDNPASNRFAGPDCRQLSDVRAARVTNEETMFARSGRQPPRFVIQPQNVRSTEGETAKLHAKAEGVPSPSYQWFTVDRAGNGQIIASGTDAELSVQNPPLGLTRYVVRASNSQGDVTSEVVTLSVEQKLRLSQARPASDIQSVARSTAPSYVRSADDIDRQRRRIEAEKAQEQFQRRLRRKKTLAICGAILAITVIGGLLLWKQRGQNLGGKVIQATNQVSFGETATANPPRQANQTNEPAKQQLNETPPVANTVRESQSTKPQESRPPEGFGLPAGWAQILVGTVTNYRAECVDEKPPLRFDLAAAALGFLTNSDNVLFVCRTNPGQEFKATLLKLGADSPESRTGIMLRESQKTNSAFLFVGASPRKIFAYHRDAKGTFSSHEAEIPKGAEGSPLILKFDQKDGQFTAAYTFNSKVWSGIPGFVISAKAETLVGFAISSGSIAERATARVVEVSPIKQQ